MPSALLPALTPGVRAGAVLLATAIPLVGCGVPPELAAPRQRTAATPATSSATPTTAASPRPVPTTPAATPTLGDLTAVDCRGNPSAEQVKALLRRSTDQLAGTKTTIAVPPRCAGTWQYTVIDVSGREPLQVVTTGRPSSLTLVTAGTDVCTIRVRTEAPPGIRALACDGVPWQAPGA